MPDAKGRNPEFHPGFHGLDAVVNRPHELIHVVAPPIGAVGNASVVAGKSGVVVEGDARLWIGIKIVVKMNAVHVVAPQNVHHHAQHVAAHLGQTWVENTQRAIG